MKVNGISGFSAFSVQKAEQKSVNCLSLSNASGYSPLRLEHFSNAINFTGGYSVNLAQTVEKLSKSVYPPGVFELAIETVENGNPEDKTLIDIHKEKYSKILQMETLDEVKAAYPEFKDVLSDDEIEYVKGSFIDDVKKDKIEAFDPDVDLALQLLQMYWAEGFSLNDLKEYTDGKNIFGVLEKLNIPRLNPTYGSVLKLSDKEYNARITGMMSERQKEAAVRRAEKRDGIYIPRGPLTEEHKKKISDGLIKHYGEHPEKGLAISERMKQYWQNHPEEIERLSLVVTTAWALPESKSIRKKLSKFMGKKDITPEEFVKMLNEERTGEVIVKRPTLKAFWDRNSWAREQWSKCMSKAWSKVKNDEKTSLEPDYVIKIYPDAVKDNLLRWIRANGYDVGRISDKNLTALYYGDKKVPPSDKYAGNLISSYFSSDVARSSLMANVYHVAIMKTITDVVFEPDFKEQGSGKQRYDQFIKTGLAALSDRNNTFIRELDSTEARNIYLNLVLFCYRNGETKIAQRLQENIETSYNVLQNDDKNTMQSVIGRFRFLAAKNGVRI